MRHYSEGEWIKFNNGDCPQESARLMEEHLQSCAGCLEIFLDLVNREDIARAEETIPRDFTQSVMQLIDQKPSIPIQAQKNVHNPACKRQRLLVYYAAAAVLTLAFMGGGVFQALVDSYPDDGTIASGLNGQKVEQKLNVNLSDRIADTANQWLNSLENQK